MDALMTKYLKNHNLNTVNRLTKPGNRQLTGYLVTSPPIRGEVNRLGNLLGFGR